VRRNELVGGRDRPVTRASGSLEMNRSVNILLALRTQFAFDREVVLGLARCARTFGNVVLHPKQFIEQSTWEMAQAIKADGIIISDSSSEEVEELAAKQIPCVNVANDIERHHLIPVVGNDDKIIGETVASYYLQRGYRYFAFFGEPTVEYFRPRREAFCRVVEAAGCQCAIGPTSLDNSERGRLSLDEHDAAWLAQLQKPLGIMCPYDVYAVQAIQALRILQAESKGGWRIPEEVSVVGVDNDPMLCLTVSPQISSVATSGFKIGFTALELLLEMIDGKPPPPQPILIPPGEIVQRGSSGEMAIADPDVAAAVNYIKFNLGHSITIGKMVDALAVSRRTLERKFAQVLGRTPSEQIRHARISHAKQLLIETDLSLREVARRSGFVWQQRLANILREDCKMTPVEFRKRFRRED